MRIITANPILTKSNEDFYSLDATSPKSEIKAFQRYAVSRGANLDYVSKRTGLLVTGEKAIDGVFGKKTREAYALYGKDWEATKPTATSGGGSTTATSGGGSTTTSGDGSNINVGVGEVSGSVEPTTSTKPSLIERFKAMSTTKKVLVVALPIVVVVAVVLIMKRTNK